MNQLYNQKHLKSFRRELRTNQTDAERLLWSRLRNKQLFNLKFFRQYAVENFVLDFYCPAVRLAIELDGGQHAEDVHQARDEQRSRTIERYGIAVIRFWNNEVFNNLPGVLETISRAATASDEPPSSPFSKGGNIVS